MEKEYQINGTLVVPVSGKVSLRVHLSEDGIAYCMKDVCEILGKSYKKARGAIEQAKFTWHRTPTDGGMQFMVFISQEHLFDFIDNMPFGRVKILLDILTETVTPAIEALLLEYAHSEKENVAKASTKKPNRKIKH